MYGRCCCFTVNCGSWQQYGADVVPVPLTVVLVHLMFLLGVVVFAHHPAVFMGLFLFFLGFTSAYARHQNPLILREALLVAFFLAGLVVLGGMQQWLEPILMGMDATSVYFGATLLIRDHRQRGPDLSRLTGRGFESGVQGGAVR